MKAIEGIEQGSIYKYILGVYDEQHITVPKGSIVLSAQVQSGKMCVWYLVNSKTKDTEDRVILMRGTGHSIEIEKDTSIKFIDTLQLHGGTIVFHLFEK